MVVCGHAYLVLKESDSCLRDGDGSLISYLVENGLVRFDGGL